MRKAHASTVLADLYNPLSMPPDLARAHAQLDRSTDALYGRGTFDELTRLAALLKRYEELTSVLAAPRRRRRTA